MHGLTRMRSAYVGLRDGRISSGAVRAAAQFRVLRALSRLKRKDFPYSSPSEYQIHRGARFVTFHSRPKEPLPADFIDWSEASTETSIVIQGAVESRSDFTLNTVHLYRRIFPCTPIILSTWNTTSREVLREIEQAGAQISLSPDPSNPGPFNTNRQMVSTAAGLLVAKQLGSRYALKSRTDQRIHRSSALAFLKEMAHIPLGRDGLLATGRIVAPSLNTFKFRLYGLSDQLQFGYVTDLETMWSGELDDRTPSSMWDSPKTPREYASLRICEVRFTSSYLERIGWPLKWSLADSWNSFGQAFVVVDSASLDLLWPKYSTSEDRWRRYERASPLEEVAFADWYLMSGGRHNGPAKDWEEVLDRIGWEVPAK